MKRSKNSKKLLLTSVIFLLVAGATGALLKNNTMIQAKPNDGNPIKIDTNTDTPFTLPFDGGPVLERELTNQAPKFAQYVQDRKRSLGFFKEKMSAFSSRAQDVIYPQSIQVLDDGKVAFIITSRTEWITPVNFTQTLCLVDEKGQLLDSINIASGKATNLASEDSVASGEHIDSNGSLDKISGNQFSYKYSGFSPNNKTFTDNELRVEFVGNKIMNPTWRNFIYQGGVGNQSAAYKTTLLGNNAQVSYGINYEPHNAPPYHTLWNWVNDRYVPQVNLQFPDRRERLTSGQLWGSWLNDLGKDSVNNGYYGFVYVLDTTNSQNNSYLCYWDAAGNRTDIFDMGYTKVSSGLLSTSILRSASSDKVIYLRKLYTDKTELVKIDIAKGKNNQEVLLTLPPNSSISMDKNTKEDGYIIYGQNGQQGNIASDLAPFLKDNDVYVGYLDNDFKPVTARGIASNGTATPWAIVPLKEEQYFFAGLGNSRDFSDPPAAGWQENPLAPETKNNAFYGTISLVDDFSPVIKTTDPNLIVDIHSDQQEIKKKLIDNLEVYDTYDFSPKNISGQKTMAWLRERINRNPLEPTLPIDWKALGLDLSNTGPQLITPFIADSEKQATATSQWLNKTTPQTVIEDEYAFDVQNFALPLTDVGSLTEQQVKVKAQSTAWNIAAHTIDELARDNSFSPKVTLAAAQLVAIQNADKAKPYPLDLTYATSKGAITNRVWVFVTNPNTAVDTDSKTVLYGDDYKYPLDKAPNTTVDQQIKSSWSATKPNLLAYDYAATQKTGTELTPLSDGAKDGSSQGLTLLAKDLQRIKASTTESTLQDVGFTYTNAAGKTTEVLVNVSMYHEQSTLTITFVDQDQTELHNPITITGNVNDKIDLTTQKAVQDAIATTSNEGYTLLERPADEAQIILTDDSTQTVAYSFDGKLQFTHVTENLKLSPGKIAPFQQTLSYENPVEDFTVQVKDTRSYKKTGADARGTFKVNVALTKEFTSSDGKALREARLLYKNQEILQTGLDITRSQQSATEQERKDFTFLLDTKAGTKENGFSLKVPAGSAEAKTYEAELTWDLIQGP